MKVCVTDFPFVLFLMTAVPEVVLVAVTVTVTRYTGWHLFRDQSRMTLANMLRKAGLPESPAEKVIPEKSYA